MRTLFVVALVVAAASVGRAGAQPRESVIARSEQAWALFLADRQLDALGAYALVLDQAPIEAPVHREAILVVAAMLADRDWDRDGAADAATPLERLALLPTDRVWSGALWLETAHALHLCSRDGDAIAVADAALARWPGSARGTSMEPACRRERARPPEIGGRSDAERAAAAAVCARHGL